MKTFKIFSGCHIKACLSLKRRAILKTPSTIFRRTHPLSLGFKMKPSVWNEQAFSCSVKTKTNTSFALKVAKGVIIPFSVYSIKDFVQKTVLFIKIRSAMWSYTHACVFLKM